MLNGETRRDICREKQETPVKSNSFYKVHIVNMAISYVDKIWKDRMRDYGLLPKMDILCRIISVILPLSICGCIERDADIDLFFEGEKPVLYCLLHTDSVVTAQLFFSKAPLYDTITYFHSPTIQLFENDEVVDSLNEVRPGVFRSQVDFKPVAGNQYQLVVIAEELESQLVTPSEIIPTAPTLDSIIVIDSSTFEFGLSNFPQLNLYIERPTKDDAIFLYGLEALFDHVSKINTSDLFVLEPDDCTPGINGFDYSNLEGKDFNCLMDISLIRLGWYYGNDTPKNERYRFTWGTMNRSAVEFFESSRTDNDYDETELFFQPAVLKSNIPGGYGLFSAYSTIDYEIVY